MKQDIYTQVTNKIVTALEQGTIPWERPWKNASQLGLPQNAVTGREYNGINVFLLWLAAAARGFSTDRWLTYKQAVAAGGHVRKGETSNLAVLYKHCSKPKLDETGLPVFNDEGEQVVDNYAVIRSFNLFNLDQCEGLPDSLTGPGAVSDVVAEEFDSIAAADEIIWASMANIRHGGNSASYSPIADVIKMPEPGQFFSREAYYATLLHELTHWSGHAKRLEREGIVKPEGFGTASYAFEELIAEMGAAFLCAHAGIQGELQHDSYISHWVKILKSDKKAIFKASGQARKATEFLLSFAQQSNAVSISA